MIANSMREYQIMVEEAADELRRAAEQFERLAKEATEQVNAVVEEWEESMKESDIGKPQDQL
jgi:hypothetical protein